MTTLNDTLNDILEHVEEMTSVISKQQAEINWLTDHIREQRLLAQESRRHVYTSLIDPLSRKPIGDDRGTGVVTMPVTPMIVTNSAGSEGTTLDTSSFNLTGVDDVTFTSPGSVREAWIGMFDVVTDELLVIFKIDVLLPAGGSVTITFKGKLVAW